MTSIKYIYDNTQHETWLPNDLIADQIIISHNVTVINSRVFADRDETIVVNDDNEIFMIGPFAFENNRGLTRLCLPNVYEIEESAFEGSSLTSIIIPLSVDLCQDCFADSDLSEVSIIEKDLATFKELFFSYWTDELLALSDFENFSREWNGEWQHFRADITPCVCDWLEAINIKLRDRKNDHNQVLDCVSVVMTELFENDVVSEIMSFLRIIDNVVETPPSWDDDDEMEA